MTQLVRLVALVDGRELGAIDGEELTISVTDDAELVVTNGHSGLYGPIVYGWEDLLPGFHLGMRDVRLELRIITRADEVTS